MAACVAVAFCTAMVRPVFVLAMRAIGRDRCISLGAGARSAASESNQANRGDPCNQFGDPHINLRESIDDTGCGALLEGAFKRSSDSPLPFAQQEAIHASAPVSDRYDSQGHCGLSAPGAAMAATITIRQTAVWWTAAAPDVDAMPELVTLERVGTLALRRTSGKLFLQRNHICN